MKIIKLSQGLVTKVDDEDYEKLNKHKWYALMPFPEHPEKIYAVRSIKNKKTGRWTSKAYMHRVIMGNPKGKHVDHKKHNTLDNRKDKLRVLTPSQNRMNSKKNKNNTSGETGVSYNKSMKMWESKITINKKVIRLGYFKSFKNAVAIRREAASNLFGEYTMANSMK